MIDPVTVARSWSRKATVQGDPFDQFIALWIAFNALYAGFGSSERQCIREFGYQHLTQLAPGALLTLLGSPAARFFGQRVIRDVRGGGDTAEDAVIVRSPTRTPIRRMVGLLMALYQVRCNLFHGNKLYDRDSDRLVITNAATALSAVLNAHLSRHLPPT